MDRVQKLPVVCGIVLITLLFGAKFAAMAQKDDKDLNCSAANPQSICHAGTTCGSSTTPCVINVRRGSYTASATPNIPDAKANRPFCVKAGTTITWQSGSKSTGFILDFGQNSPFESQSTITGGSKKSVSLVAKKPGCYKFSVSACREAAVSGMCTSGNAELVVTVGEN